jgi:hypothetical protein
MSNLKTTKCDICGSVYHEGEYQYNFFSSNVIIFIPATSKAGQQDIEIKLEDICQSCYDGLVKSVVDYIDTRKDINAE